MEKIIFTTVYDEVLHKIETIGFSNIDLKYAYSTGVIKGVILFEDRRGGSLQITLTNLESLIEEKRKFCNVLDTQEKILAFIKSVIQKHVMLTAQDIMIYRILLAHYINNQENGCAVISLDKIHKIYRGKAISYGKNNEKYDKETLQAYSTTLAKLCSITVSLNFGESNLKVAKQFSNNEINCISGKLLGVTRNVNPQNIATTEFGYTLGKVGEYFIKSNQYGQFLPREIYSLRFNQIDTFNMSVYIAKMIVINRCKKKEITIHVSTLLNRIMKYDKKGYCTGQTYMNYLSKLDSVKRNKKLKYIEKQLNYILELLKSKESIERYKYNLNFMYKYIKDGELSVQIVVGKKNKSKR